MLSSPLYFVIFMFWYIPFVGLRFNKESQCSTGCLQSFDKQRSQEILDIWSVDDGKKRRFGCRWVNKLFRHSVYCEGNRFSQTCCGKVHECMWLAGCYMIGNVFWKSHLFLVARIKLQMIKLLTSATLVNKNTLLSVKFAFK